jgi:FkbM family methyltransferase
MEGLLHGLVRAFHRMRLAAARTRAGWMRTPLGFEMKLDLADPLDQGFYLGSYERGLIALVDLLVSPGSTCVDVGAQKGYVTLRLAQRTGAGGRVLSFDPDHRAFALLSENCLRNGASHVILHPIALGDQSSTLRLFLNKQLGNTSAFPNEFAQPSVIEEVQVPVRRLDDVIAELSDTPAAIDFVKIDAEGAESLVLAGMAHTIRRLGPPIAIELNYKSLACAGTSALAIASRLRADGYQLYTYDLVRSGLRRRLVLREYDEHHPKHPHMEDVMCVRPGTLAWSILQPLHREAGASPVT